MLNSWAKKTDQKIQVFRLDLLDLTTSRLAPKSTAYEQDIFALTRSTVGGNDQQFVETHCLQRIDSIAARILRKIETTGLTSLTPEDQSNWVFFLISLRLRHPENLHYIKTKATQYFKDSLNERPEEYDAISKAFDPPTLEEFVEKHIPGLAENFGLINFEQRIYCENLFKKMLRKSRWILQDFQGLKNHLILADYPSIYTAGIDDPNLVIILPIGPQKAFIATNPQNGDIIAQQSQKNLLRWINEMSINQARYRIYAQDMSPRRFILNHMRKNMNC